MRNKYQELTLAGVTQLCLIVRAKRSRVQSCTWRSVVENLPIGRHGFSTRGKTSRSKNKVRKSCLVLIIFLALFLRFWQIDSFPPLNRDEAAIGYNAYSILKTGRDEHREFLPLSFKSFGDYKMPGYIYAAVLPVKLFGLNGFSVRFWSAVGGVAAVASLYYLSLWIFKRLKMAKSKEKLFALLAAFILAVNPWHLYFSRVGFEANLNLTFLILALTFLVYGFKKRFLLIFSSLCFIAMLYLYSSSFIFLPLFLPLTVIIFRKDLLKKRSNSAFAGLDIYGNIWLLASLIILLVGVTHATWSVWQVSKAKQGITIFSDPTINDSFNKKWTENFAKNPLQTKLWFNKYFFFSRIISRNYLRTFSPNFLFLKGGNHPWQKIPGIGYFYILDILFIVLGLVFLFNRKKINWFILGWLLLSPIPSAITVDAPHATRMLQIIPIIVIVIVIGLMHLWRFLLKTKKWARISVVVIIIILYFFQIGRFAYLYALDYPNKLPKTLMPGINKAIDWPEEQDEDRLVIFSNPLDFPYVYVAFYTRMDPSFFQKNTKWKPADLANMTAVKQIGKYRFWEGLPEVDQKAFYVLQGEREAPANFSLKHQIRNKDKIEWSIYAN